MICGRFPDNKVYQDKNGREIMLENDKLDSNVVDKKSSKDRYLKFIISSIYRESNPRPLGREPSAPTARPGFWPYSFQIFLFFLLTVSGRHVFMPSVKTAPTLRQKTEY